MNVVVIGGGIAGLMAAIGAQKANPGAKITLLERSSQWGGLLAGKSYDEERLYFDVGTHIFQETGDSEYDAILLDSVPEKELLHFPIGLGDVSGAVFDGRLQTNTSAPDIRRRKDKEQLIADLRQHVAGLEQAPPLKRERPLLEAASLRFGKLYAETVIGPVLSHAFGLPMDKLAAFSLELAGVSRVVIDEHQDWLRSARNESYRSIAAIPDQRNLPEEFRHSRRSFYSKTHGSKAFIDGLVQRLANGNDLLLSAQVEKVNLPENEIHYQISGAKHVIHYDRLILAAGAIGAAHLLGIDLADFSFDRPMPHRLMHLRLVRECPSDLCYLYGLDRSCKWYRVTNYKAFSGREEDRRLTIELVGQRKSDEEPTPSAVTSHLAEIGLLDSADFTFCDTERLPAGFPSPTRDNVASLINLNNRVTERLPGNATLCGIGSGKGLFFQNEVGPDAFRKARELTAK